MRLTSVSSNTGTEAVLRLQVERVSIKSQPLGAACPFLVMNNSWNLEQYCPDVIFPPLKSLKLKV